MKGKRNQRDGLYDIPLTKNFISENDVEPAPKGVTLSSKINSIQSISNMKTHISNTPYLQRAVNTLKMTKFNNIINPIINKNLKTIIPIAITEKLNVILRKTKTKKDFVDFLHGAMFSPVPSTWIKGIENNQFSTWSGLDCNLVSKHLQSKIARAEDHLKQEQLGLQSTKKKYPLRTKTA